MKLFFTTLCFILILILVPFFIYKLYQGGFDDSAIISKKI